MSTSQRFIEQYVGNPKFVDLLRAILDLNQYESLSLIALTLTNESSPAKIADVTGIPRSKIYQTFASLEEKNLLEKQKDGYEIKSSQVYNLQNTSEELSKGFENFIQRIVDYSLAPSKTEGIVLEKIKKLLVTLGYHVTLPEEIQWDQNHHHFSQYFFHRISRMGFEQRGLMRELEANPEELIEKFESSNLLKKFVNFVGESSTSGVKVSFFVLSNSLFSEYQNMISTAISMASEILNCDVMIVIPLPQVDYKKIDPDLMNKTSKIYFIPPFDSNFEKTISKILTDLDRNWRESKIELDSISSEITELKRTLASTLDTTYKLNREARDAEKFGGRYQEILKRIETDLITSDDSLSTIRSEYENLLERLESHSRVPSKSSIIAIKERTFALKQSVEKKIQAVGQLSEDLLSYIKGEKKYSEYGFSTNPFIFTVPPEEPDEMVNQELTQKSLGLFVDDMINGSLKNFQFLVADEGMGKTHTLNYFANQVNEQKFGNSIALRLNCKPRSDIIDLYPQIYNTLSRVIKGSLQKEISDILEFSGVPKGITEFLQILREINARLIKSGCKGVFMMIDDFENTLPLEETNITPRSILQMRDLAKLENIGFVIALRKTYWETWGSEIKKRISKIKRAKVVTLKSFTERETLQLIAHRLKKYQDLPVKKSPPVFSMAVIKIICNNAKGVPRNIISIAREVFRISVKTERAISPDLLKEVNT